MTWLFDRGNERISWYVSGAVLLALLLPLGCGGKENPGPDRTVSQPNKKSNRGENCLARNDCKKNLVCIDNTCVTKNYDISPTARHCERIECTSEADCCDADSQRCQELSSQCGSGNAESCQDYHRECCDEACRDGTCVPTRLPCTPGQAECPGDRTCANGRCFPSCMNDGDCSGDLICVQGRCQEGCRQTSECPLLSACQNNECTEVGCQSDRECIIVEDDPNAVCGENGECRIPCNYDAECARGQGDFQVCQDGFCVFAGCENDTECRAYLGVSGDPDVQAVCRQPPSQNQSGNSGGSGSSSSGGGSGGGSGNPGSGSGGSGDAGITG